MSEQTESPSGAPTAAGRVAPLSPVGAEVARRVSRLQTAYLSKNSGQQAFGTAALARLRRGVGKAPGAIHDILEFTLADEFVRSTAGDEPTREEIAAHACMTLYALHQQSQSERMHQRGYGMGRSIRALTPKDPTDKPAVLKRFQVLGTADSLEELLHHTRGMIQLLRSNRIPLDYGLLADELVRWQRSDGPNQVRLQWGRDFYRAAKPTDQ